ncbi:conserved hypothetical protein [Neospora caninum Liverpool]|uniref:Uncharacterized protein n=1 Tax=Neospora caninum (strain Liverpool) TaxID=572307 RepID=F0VBK8_NEOCL|nr:conserved hypothetical protein [Neospora caninum Liverpool]CBZ50992.1 conserved hypothetical protein [Neospora caninum Liverpool]CEL68295.1 TPA: hypothetical protein BN1204_040660 [Neospora caninum Liverpool]|eukprot:XP_003881025.1 conserved hypothetical protein [Neospora caninum Liverpool]
MAAGANDIQVRLRRLWEKQREIIVLVEDQFLDLSSPPGGTLLDLQKAATRTESYVKLLFGRSRAFDAEEQASPRYGENSGPLYRESGRCSLASPPEHRPDPVSLIRVIKEVHVVTNRSAGVPSSNLEIADDGAGGENPELPDEHKYDIRDGASRQLELQPFTQEQLELLQKLRGNFPPLSSGTSARSVPPSDTGS